MYPPITGTQNTGLFLKGDRPQYIIGIYIPFVGIPIMVDDQYPSHVLTAHLTWECEKLGRHGLSFQTLDPRHQNRKSMRSPKDDDLGIPMGFSQDGGTPNMISF